jgi:hypothetical protein
LAHRTVRGATDSVRCTREINSELLSFGFSPVPLRYNSPDCPVCLAEQRLLRQRSSAKGEQCVNSARIVRAESEQHQKAHQTVNSSRPVRHRTVRCPKMSGSNGRNRQNPNGWVTWLAHRTVSGGAPGCPVRPSTAALPNSCFGGWGYKYPQPPPFKASKFPAICIQYKSSRLHSKTQNKRSNPLQVPNSF